MRDAVRLMHEKSLQIKELTDQLMGQEGIRWEDIEDIAFLFSQLVQEWEEILEERFTIRTDLSGLAALEGRMDIFSLKRIFDNLISNIEKYADEEKEIILKVENQNRCVIITQENGIRRTNVRKTAIGSVLQIYVSLRRSTKGIWRPGRWMGPSVSGSDWKFLRFFRILQKSLHNFFMKNC